MPYISLCFLFCITLNLILSQSIFLNDFKGCLLHHIYVPKFVYIFLYFGRLHGFKFSVVNDQMSIIENTLVK